MTDEFSNEVRDALSRMKAGEASAGMLATLVAAAEAFAALVPEYVFKSPQTGLVYATQNGMLADVMQASRPDEELLIRFAPPLPESWTSPTTKTVDQ